MLELLDALAAAGVQLDVWPGQRLVTDAPTGTITEDLAQSIRTHRDMLVAIMVGRSTGHAPGVCTACGEISLVSIRTSADKTRVTWPTCRLTPRCTGRHIPRGCDSELTDRVAPPPQAKPPKKRPKAILLGPKQPWPLHLTTRPETPT